MSIRNKKVTVVGLARSGVAASNCLASLGAKVFATDSKGPDALTESIGRLEKSVELFLGGHPDRIFLEADFIVISPGVPMDIRPLTLAKGRGVPIISELEFSYLLTDTPFIAITGTNGKSTTTVLIDLMMRKAGFKTILGGNIGRALTEEIYKLQFTVHGSRFTDYIVSEVSSFQLEGIDTFRPKVATILNITPDHLDRYKDLDDYVNAKARIFKNQGDGDFLILNADDPEIVKVESEKLKVKSKKPNIFFFSRKKEVEGVYLKDGMIYFNFPDSSLVPHHSSLVRVDDISIKGVHNLENAMAASGVALIAGCSVNAIRGVLREFSGLEHRLEFVEEIKGVSFVNDSKGTNVGAVLKSLESFNSPVILIAGGLDKVSDFTILRYPVKEKVKHMILIGEAKEKISKALDGFTEISFATTMEEAVGMAAMKATPGDTVLLSPACASFDMFEDFEDRGKRFKEAVRGLKYA
jgi:UDP-N-acetylmuramoylalanine--D-glutamate ligase